MQRVTAAGVASANITIATALKAAGFTDFLKLLEAAGAGPRAADPRTRATLLCPTNQARSSRPRHGRAAGRPPGHHPLHRLPGSLILSSLLNSANPTPQ